jgi:hypothetical protein
MLEQILPTHAVTNETIKVRKKMTTLIPKVKKKIAIKDGQESGSLPILSGIGRQSR